MPSKTQPSVPFNVRLAPVVYNALEEHAKLTGKTKTDVVDEALRKMIGLKMKADR